MNDSCICLNLDYEPAPKVFQEKVCVARKEYQCCECRELIVKGQQYQHTKGLWDSCWMTFRTCLTCVRIRKDFFSCGYAYEEMWDEIHEVYCGDGICICPSRELEQQID